MVVLVLLVITATASLIHRSGGTDPPGQRFRRLRRATGAAAGAFGAMWLMVGEVLGLSYTRTGTGWLYHAVTGMSRATAIIEVAAVVADRVLAFGSDSSGHRSGTRLLRGLHTLSVATILLFLAAWGVFAPRW